MRPIGRRNGLAALAVALAATGCGNEWGLLVTVHCDAPCSLTIPTEVDELRIHLTQPSVNPPPFDQTYALTAGDSFPLSVSVLAGDGAQEGTVVASVDALLNSVVVADGFSSGPLREDRQIEIIVELTPL